MDFELHPAPAALAHPVKAIWCARGTQQEFSAPEPIVPDGCVEIVFNLGDPFVDASTGAIQPRALIAGQMTRPVIALPTGSVDLIGVRFHTACAGAALHVPMHELQDRLIDGASVISGLNHLADDLRNVDSHRRLEHLALTLAGQMTDVDAGAPTIVDRALGIIDRLKGVVGITDLANHLGISRRHLERQFREEVGLSAKQLSQIVRIHSALDLLRQTAMSGAEIAAACGYSDQAHLIRECQRLAGRTPLGLKTTQRSLASHLYSQPR